MAKKMENMTIADLEAAIQENANERRELKQEALAYQERIDQLKAQAKFAAMTASERTALVQSIMDAGGIESLEQVGKPG